MFKRFIICSFLLSVGFAQAGEPLSVVVEIGRDAQLNLKKIADMQNPEKQIAAACAKGKLFSTKKKTLRSHNGKFCDGSWASSYVLLMCDNGKNKGFYASKCYKKAIISLKLDAKNTKEARVKRHKIAQARLRLWFKGMAKKSMVDVMTTCQALFDKTKKGASHPRIKVIDDVAIEECRFYSDGARKLK